MGGGRVGRVSEQVAPHGGIPPAWHRLPASADRLHIQSLPNCEVWRGLSTTDDVGVVTQGHGVPYRKGWRGMPKYTRGRTAFKTWNGT